MTDTATPPTKKDALTAFQALLPKTVEKTPAEKERDRRLGVVERKVQGIAADLLELGVADGDPQLGLDVADSLRVLFSDATSAIWSLSDKVLLNGNAEAPAAEPKKRTRRTKAQIEADNAAAAAETTVTPDAAERGTNGVDDNRPEPAVEPAETPAELSSTDRALLSHQLDLEVTAELVNPRGETVAATADPEDDEARKARLAEKRAERQAAQDQAVRDAANKVLADPNASPGAREQAEKALARVDGKAVSAAAPTTDEDGF